MIFKLFLILINLLFCIFSASRSTKLDHFELEQMINLFETNYIKAKIDPYLLDYKDYLLNKIADPEILNKNELQENLNFFNELEKSYILFYIRNPIEGYIISFPNEEYYLWRIKVK